MKKILAIIYFLWSMPAMADAVIDKNLLNEMLTTINNEYLQKVDNAAILSEGLNALHRIDDKIKVVKDEESFYFYYDNQINRIAKFPQNKGDINAWVEATSQILDSVMKASEKARIKDFTVPDLMMQKITQSLDKYSSYHSEFDYKEEEENNAIFTLYADRMINDILYLRVRIFNKQTADSVYKSINAHPEAKGIILDLRGNSGGIFNEALKVADFFTDNAIITYTAGRDQENIRYYTSAEGAIYNGPLVVIVDENTASAAEVLAGGLQEQSRAKIIGTTTFGKGTIQNITQMSNGGKLVLTTEQFFTPSGAVIHEKGIEPDICLSQIENGKCLRQERQRLEKDIDEALKLLHGN